MNSLTGRATTALLVGVAACVVTAAVIARPSGRCAGDSWIATSTISAPDARDNHTAVWTGSEMIVWGGSTDIFPFVINTGGRYRPGTDSWTATSTTDAPSGRIWHTAVWTGSEMIVWGGVDGTSNYVNTGGRYNPSTDTWTATSTTDAPSGRSQHTAVWTGSEMIVMGGYDGNHRLNTGGRYNPSTDSWTPISTTNAPVARSSHTAVWTGSEMIVWGGDTDNFPFPTETGGKYNPSTDSWTATSTTNAPFQRSQHTAVWTGSRMIIWGGFFITGPLNTGGQYDSSTDSWTATSIISAPDARNSHTAVWTGNEMIVWGGASVDSPNGTNNGGRYNPDTDTWTATNTTNAPSGRYLHTAAFWTAGSEMIVWGGSNPNEFLNTGGRYCAAPTPRPSPTPRTRPTPRLRPTPPQ